AAPRAAETPGVPESTAPLEHHTAEPGRPGELPGAWPEGAGRRYRAAHEQAAHDLDLAISLVVGAPRAATSLAHLVDHRCADPEGALVFACLLHLVGHREAAQFWWQFAAGGGSRTAAFCLYLHHRCLAEFRDADHWRDQAARLARGPRRRTTAAPGPHSFLLSDTVRRDLLRQCHRGRHPHLPPTVEAVINRLPVTGDDEDFGEVPQPVSHLPAELARSRG
ncbi:MAG TPA: glycoprotein, partial [Streptomyces sp.]|nr:glycoprotein [Streptomyces sp.]